MSRIVQADVDFMGTGLPYAEWDDLMGYVRRAVGNDRKAYEGAMAAVRWIRDEAPKAKKPWSIVNGMQISPSLVIYFDEDEGGAPRYRSWPHRTMDDVAKEVIRWHYAQRAQMAVVEEWLRRVNRLATSGTR